MTTRRPPCLAFLCLVFLCSIAAPRLPALERITDGAQERVKFTESVRQLFLADEFDLLDQMADLLWRDRSRFADGTWKLAGFYRAFMVSSSDAKVDWEDWWRRYARWQKQAPNSATARVMQALTLTNYAWEARGGGWADSVASEGWRLFGERLQQGRRILESDPALKRIPGYYHVMLTVALGQGWSPEKEKKLFDEAVKLAPDYEEFYFKRAYYLQPKWHGRPGEWLEFAGQAADATEKELGQILYARIVWAERGPRTQGRWEDEKVDWPRLKRGFEDMIARWPDSWWNKNAFCYFACQAQDRETAKRLFDELRDRYALEIWTREQSFLMSKRWANGRPMTREERGGAGSAPGAK